MVIYLGDLSIGSYFAFKSETEIYTILDIYFDGERDETDTFILKFALVQSSSGCLDKFITDIEIIPKAEWEFIKREEQWKEDRKKLRL